MSVINQINVSGDTYDIGCYNKNVIYQLLPMENTDLPNFLANQQNILTLQNYDAVFCAKNWSTPDNASIVLGLSAPLLMRLPPGKYFSVFFYANEQASRRTPLNIQLQVVGGGMIRLDKNFISLPPHAKGGELKIYRHQNGIIYISCFAFF